MPSRSLSYAKIQNSANYKDNYTNDYNDNYGPTDLG